MANSINHVTFSGNLGQDPEMKYTSGGKELTSASLAVSSSYKKGDEWVNETSWFRLKAWGKVAVQLNGLKKGDLVIVHGSLKIEEWEKDGQKQRTPVVTIDTLAQMVRPPRAEQDSASADTPLVSPQKPAPAAADDDFPF
jgi:single-strand DNA-binding protein